MVTTTSRRNGGKGWGGKEREEKRKLTYSGWKEGISFLFFKFSLFLKELLIYFCSAGFSLLCGCSLVAVHGFSLQWLLLLRSTGSRVCRLQVVLAHGLVVESPGLWSTGSGVLAHGSVVESPGLWSTGSGVLAHGLVVESPGLWSTASAVLAHGLVAESPGLWSTGSGVVAVVWAPCAQLLRGLWDLLGPAVEHTSPPLASRFFTTAPPGKS